MVGWKRWKKRGSQTLALFDFKPTSIRGNEGAFQGVTGGNHGMFKSSNCKFHDWCLMMFDDLLMMFSYPDSTITYIVSYMKSTGNLLNFNLKGLLSPHNWPSLRVQTFFMCQQQMGAACSLGWWYILYINIMTLVCWLGRKSIISMSGSSAGKQQFRSETLIGENMGQGTWKN